MFVISVVHTFAESTTRSGLGFTALMLSLVAIVPVSSMGKRQDQSVLSHGVFYLHSRQCVGCAPAFSIAR